MPSKSVTRGGSRKSLSKEAFNHLLNLQYTSSDLLQLY